MNVVARKLSIDEAPIWSELKKITAENSGIQGGQNNEFTKMPETIKGARSENLLKKIYGFILWQKEIADSDKTMIQEAEDRVKVIVGDGKYVMLDSVWQNSKDGLIFEAEVTYSGADNISGMLKNIISDLEEETLKESLGMAIAKLKKAEQRGDDAEIQNGLKECQTISQELSRIKQIKISNN